MSSCCAASTLFRYNLIQHLQYCLISLFLLFKTTEQIMSTAPSVSTCGPQSLKARHKSCFLRPDSGPCRADIVQWYFDVRQNKCYEFFWGGCQGNGNRFETKRACYDYCWHNNVPAPMPLYCELSFEYGTCFGHSPRWYWDKYYMVCKRRMYSGCGGNQNNFASYDDCRAICKSFDTCKSGKPSQSTSKKPQGLTMLDRKHKSNIT